MVVAGLQFGGQLMTTTDVENYPGFPQAVSGPEMMELFQKQAERFGSEVLLEDATRVVLTERPFRIETASRTFTSDAVILATGATAKWRGIDSEKRFQNKGVSACATCDGALFRGKPMAVVAAATRDEEDSFLPLRAQVTVIHRAQVRASKSMQERAWRSRSPSPDRGRGGARRRIVTACGSATSRRTA